MRINACSKSDWLRIDFILDTLYLLGVDVVVFSMSPNESDKDNLALEVDPNNQSIAIPFDVENNALIRNDAGASVRSFYIVRR